MIGYGRNDKITYGSPGGLDSEYAAKRAAAEAQAMYIDMGIRGVETEGTGRTFMETKQDPYRGNVNHTIGDMQQGMNSNFSAESSTYNAPLENPDRQTGSMTYATSSTNDPQTDPQDLDQSALAARIQRMAENGSINLNPSSVYGLS